MLLWWMAMTALASDPCDGAALERALADASTLRVPAAYTALAACDPARAKTAAPSALERMYGDDPERDAVVAMVDAGASDAVFAWLRDRVPADDRLAMLRAIGSGCADGAPREQFFLDLHEALGSRFYIDRWHRGLDGCRTDAGRALLTDALSGDEFGMGSSDRGAFLDILEVYARNLRAGSLDLLGRYARELTDPEEVSYVLQILPRAAGYDTEAGVVEEEAVAVAALVEDLGRELDTDRVDLARVVLQRIEQDDAAGRMVRYRWPDSWRVGGGRYHYAAAVVADWECRSGKHTVHVHTGEFVEDGAVWPDQIGPAAPDRLPEQWGVLGDPPCDASPDVSVFVSERPLKTADDRRTWIEEQRTQHGESARGRKVEFADHEDFIW